MIADAVALLGLGACAARLPLAGCGFLATLLCGLGVLLCLPPVIWPAQPVRLTIPFGPPGLSLHFALDPLSLFFLITVLLAATAVAAFQSVAGKPTQVRVTAFAIAGTILALLAADGIALTLALAVPCAAIANRPSIVVPLLLFGAVCLLTPAGYAPRFDAIRAAPIDPGHAAAAAALTIAAVGAMTWRSTRARCATQDALTAGLLIPFACYVLLRLIADLSATAVQAWCGSVLLLAGGAVTVVQAWRAAESPDLDAAIAALARRQTGLAIAGIGLAVIAHTADLPGAATLALEATCLTAVVAGLAGTVTALSAHVIGSSAGTYRLSRLGGLIHTMPGTSAALSGGLLAASALPSSLGFAALWLAFQSILSAPRTEGLLPQLPLALIAAAMAVSAALATAASVRIVGIAILGRPRTPRGAGAGESSPRPRTILLALAATALVAGALPGPILRLLADPAIRMMTGLPPGHGLGLLSVPGASPGYLVIPLLALLALAIGPAMLLTRRVARAPKAAGPWLNGMRPPEGLPFGDPAAQSAGRGFVPAFPELRLPRLPPLPRTRLPPAIVGLWLIPLGFGALLLVLAVIG